MKNAVNKLFVLSCCSLTTLAALSAQADEMAYAPTLEGGVFASVGTFYVIPDSVSQEYATSVTNLETTQLDRAFEATALGNPVNNDGEYDFGLEATLGYAFADTANSIELNYRWINADSDASAAGVYVIPDFGPNGSPEFLDADVANALNYELDSADLMMAQFLNIGEFMQLRLLGGLAYLNLEQENHTTYTNAQVTSEQFFHNNNSQYEGWGPRVGLDSRYDFGNGFGIVGGGSVAYFLGELNSNASTTDNFQLNNNFVHFEDNIDSHTVVNLRANLGVDYVYFFDNDEGSTLGLELGYLVDYYIDAVNTITGVNQTSGGKGTSGTDQRTVFVDAGAGSTDLANTELSSVSFSGPYLNLKGVF